MALATSTRSQSSSWYSSRVLPRQLARWSAVVPPGSVAVTSVAGCSSNATATSREPSLHAVRNAVRPNPEVLLTSMPRLSARCSRSLAVLPELSSAHCRSASWVHAGDWATRGSANSTRTTSGWHTLLHSASLATGDAGSTLGCFNSHSTSATWPPRAAHVSGDSCVVFRNTPGCRTIHFTNSTLPPMHALCTGSRPHSGAVRSTPQRSCSRRAAP